MPILKPVKPGDAVRANDMNALLTAYNADQFGGTPTPNLAGLLRICAIVAVQNLGSVALNPYEVAIISGEATANATGSAGFVLNIAQAIFDDNMGHAVICLERIEPGGCGRAVISGVFWASANAATTGAFATPIQGSSVLACSDVPGPFQVLAGAGTAMLLVRFPLPAQNDHYQYLVLNSQATTYLPGMS